MWRSPTTPPDETPAAAAAATSTPTQLIVLGAAFGSGLIIIGAGYGIGKLARWVRLTGGVPGDGTIRESATRDVMEDASPPPADRPALLG